MSGCPFPAKTWCTTRRRQLDFSADMSYGDYLHLDQVLDAQHPLSPDHNEMLFIVQHQTSELWMKLMLHELRAPSPTWPQTELQPAFKMLARVSKIMEQLVHAWDVLATMTPPEYSAIRPYLANSSGFQSWQYRCIEFSLGNKNAAMLQAARAPARAAGPGAGGLPRAVAVRRGAAPAGAPRPARAGQPHRARLDPALRGRRRVEAAWLQVYRAPRPTGTCTSWARNSPTWKTPSASGAFAT
jgi:tryptophan 2,3-dioxygenase